MMTKEADSKINFKFLDAQLLFKHIKPDHVMLLAHTSTMKTGPLARYNMTRFELQTFTFSA